MDYSPRYGRFRALLRQIRREAGLSQVGLSVKLRKSQLFVSRSELGERRIDFLETVDFCEACGVSVPDFLLRLDGGLLELSQQKRRSPRKMDSDGRLSR